MARENVIEEPTPTSSSDTESNVCDLTCPECGSGLERIDRANPACPDCRTAFSVSVHDEFALVERAGWAVALSLGGHETDRGP
ncbi:hypothetical protein [Halorussus sp. MSC15.2]|uniref:hypothetical protein n=1 Tax=Halorussus sp. MSC15.2 TaxID=2283638 RepID=UPI0013D61DE0|nr:hypothetical protein [Halorussus sp. MSC15.2]NEU57648.1 hypothetical protein [Halorussus sp. MSC15.2]